VGAAGFTVHAFEFFRVLSPLPPRLGLEGAGELVAHDLRDDRSRNRSLKPSQLGPLHGYVGLIQRFVDQAAQPQCDRGVKVTFSLNHSVL
jgi:hypothetical protein